MKHIMPVLLLMLVTSIANAGDHKKRMHIEPFLLIQHQSDILRGPPLYESGHYETTNDYMALGATFVFTHFELDLSQGRKAIDCDLSHGCPSESGSEVAVRFYPFRKR